MSHDVYSPSQTPRTTRCPGSVTFVKHLIDKLEIPEEETSVYADEGTMLHEQQDLSLHGKPLTEELDEEQKSCIQECRNWFWELHDKFNITEFSTEKKITLKGYGIDNAGGTADVVFNSGMDSLHILDWKFGRGVEVLVDANEQLIHYLAGAAQNEKNLRRFKELWIHLGQPRFDYFESYKVDLGEVLSLLDRIEDAQQSTEIIAGHKQCFWCRGKTRCAAWAKWKDNKAIQVFKTQAMMSKNEISFEQMAKALVVEADMKKVFKAIKDAMNDLTPEQLAELNLKRVAGRSNRVFVSTAKVVKYVSEKYNVDDLYQEPKLKSPAQMESSIPGLKKDKEFQKLVHKPLGKPTIVDINDPRPDYKEDAAAAFAHLAS